MTAILLSRNAEIERLNNSNDTIHDLCVVGGGIHGAVAARRATEAGLSVVLLERTDYAAETSSRSSKMAHGGLRYLEMFDFEQVFEGIKARESLFERFPHLVRPERFLIPIKSNDYFFRYKLKAGLILYDWFVQNKERKHKYIPRSKLHFDGFHSERTDLMGCFSYTDGLLDDSRMVLENITRARLSGARCVNHAEVLSARKAGSGLVEINWQDRLNNSTHTLVAKKVLNCAGPWVHKIVNNVPQPPKVLFSRGVHLLFDRPWTSPSLFLPMPGKARYYFVWPHAGGTMVGTTEAPAEVAEYDPLPLGTEIEEVLSRIKSDLPDSGLDRDSLYGAFAGVRTLPQRRTASQTTTESRKHIWFGDDSILSLLGGKYTTAEWTAKEGLERLGFKTEGSSYAKEVQALTEERITTLAQRLRLNAQQAAALCRRHLPLVSILEKSDFSPDMLTGTQSPVAEAELALECEQAQTIDDVIRRRLGLEFLPGNGLSALEQVKSLLEKRYPDRDFEKEASVYIERIVTLHQRMGKQPVIPANQEKRDELQYI